MTRASPISGLIFLFFVQTSQDCLAADAAPAPTDDPFGYCAAVRNADTPSGGASPVPTALGPYLAKALGLPAGSALPPGGYYWRCMSGVVYVCAVGANIPCDAKADRARRNLGAERYCRDNRDAKFVPAYAAGHSTIYEWSCSGGSAIRGKQVARLDVRGFRVDFWHRVSQ